MVVRSDNLKRIVGVVDVLFMSTMTDVERDDGYLHVHLKDWKYSPSILSHFIEYSLQVNMYKHLLETYYDNIEFKVCSKTYRGIIVDSMELVVFHESHHSYRIYTVHPWCTDIGKCIDDVLVQKSV